LVLRFWVFPREQEASRGLNPTLRFFFGLVDVDLKTSPAIRFIRLLNVLYANFTHNQNMGLSIFASVLPPGSTPGNGQNLPSP
jgi:hypothetical protein